jgi:biotin carboxyl carrier protein
MALITIESEITGNVWKIEAAAGTATEEEDVILILESMKMEIPVESPEKGIIKEILVSEGDQIQEGQALAILDTGD